MPQPILRQLIPLTFRGVGLSTTGRTAFFSFENGAFNTPQHAARLLSRIDKFPRYVGSSPQAKTLPLEVTVLSQDRQGQFDALAEIFDPSLGLGTLRVRDSDDRIKRVECVPQQLVYDDEHDAHIVIPLIAPDGTLEDDNLQSGAGTVGTITSTSPVLISNTNIGTADALPDLLFRPVIAKNARQGYQQMMQIAYANRSEFPLTGPASGTWLINIAPTGWDTDAIVDVSAISTTINNGVGIASLIDLPFDLVVTSTAGFDDEGILLVDPGGSEEQFEYSTVDGTTFRLHRRALGGTSITGHSDGTTIHQSRMLKDRSDVAVFLDGIQIPPQKVTVETFDPANSKVWIEIADAPRKRAILAADFSGNFVSNGDFANVVSGWSTGGSNTLTPGVTSDPIKFGSLRAAITYDNHLDLLTQDITVDNGGVHVISCWLYIPSDWDGGDIVIAAGGFGGRTGENEVDADMNIRDIWQQVFARVNVSGGDLTGTFIVRAKSAPTVGRQVFVDGCYTHEGSFVVPRGDTFAFTNDQHGFEVGDYLIWEDDGSSVVFEGRVIQVDGAYVTVDRDVRNSPTTHEILSAGGTIYRSGHHIQMAWNYAKAVARPTNPDPPLIDTHLSTNLKWDWFGKQLFSEGADRRPGGWRRILYEGRESVPELRRNRLASKTALSISGTSALFEDAEPSVDKPNFDALEFVSPVGMADFGGKFLTFDATLDYPFALQVIGRDLLGLEEVISLRQGHETGNGHEAKHAYNFQDESIGSKILQGVVLRARNLLVTGVQQTDDDLITNVYTVGTLISNSISQSFVLAETTKIRSVVIRAVNNEPSPPSSELIEVRIAVPGTDGFPFEAIAYGLTGIGSIIPGYLLPDSSGFTDICLYLTTQFPELPSGEYHLVYINNGSPGAALKVSSSQQRKYGPGHLWSASSLTERIHENIQCFILSDAVDNQEEMLKTTARTGLALEIESVSRIRFDSNRTPIVEPRAAEAAYFFNTTWRRGSERIHIQYLKREADALLGNATIEIDVKNRTVTDLELEDNIRQTIAAESDPWLSLPPGASTVEVRALDEGAPLEAHQVAFRNTWSA